MDVGAGFALGQQSVQGVVGQVGKGGDGGQVGGGEGRGFGHNEAESSWQRKAVERRVRPYLAQTR